MTDDFDIALGRYTRASNDLIAATKERQTMLKIFCDSFSSANFPSIRIERIEEDKSIRVINISGVEDFHKNIIRVEENIQKAISEMNSNAGSCGKSIIKSYIYAG